MADWKRFIDPAASAHLQTRLTDARVFIAVDASGSTEWDLGVCMNAFESEREFTLAVDQSLFQAGYRHQGRSSLKISQWGTKCGSPVTGAAHLRWTGTKGGTCPSHIFDEAQSRDCILKSDYWCLFTDGEVDDSEVQRLHWAASSYKALSIPVIILITGAKDVNQANTSVGMALYANASDAMFLYKQIGRRRSESRIYVISAKGRFAPLQKNGLSTASNGYSEFRSESELLETCVRLDIKVPCAEARSDETPGVQIATASGPSGQQLQVTVNVGALVNVNSIQENDLDTILEPTAFRNIALAARTQGLATETRSFLERQRPRAVVAELEDHSGASTLVQGLAEVISPTERRSTQSTDIQRTQRQLREAHLRNRSVYETQAQTAITEATTRNEAIDTALESLEAVESSEYNTKILSDNLFTSQTHRSNRPTPSVQVIRLRFDAPAYRSQCDICCQEDSIMSLALRKFDKGIISQNMPQYPGRLTAAASPSPLSSQIICYECAKVLMPRSIYREAIAAVIPLVQYEGANQLVINKSLSMAMNDGANIGEPQLLQIFISVIDGSLMLPWVEGDATKKDVLEWFLKSLKRAAKRSQAVNTIVPQAEAKKSSPKSIVYEYIDDPHSSHITSNDLVEARVYHPSSNVPQSSVPPSEADYAGNPGYMSPNMEATSYADPIPLPSTTSSSRVDRSRYTHPRYMSHAGSSANLAPTYRSTRPQSHNSSSGSYNTVNLGYPDYGYPNMPAGTSLWHAGDSTNQVPTSTRPQLHNSSYGPNSAVDLEYPNYGYPNATTEAPLYEQGAAAPRASIHESMSEQQQNTPSVSTAPVNPQSTGNMTRSLPRTRSTTAYEMNTSETWVDGRQAKNPSVSTAPVNPSNVTATNTHSWARSTSQNLNSWSPTTSPSTEKRSSSNPFETNSQTSNTPLVDRREFLGQAYVALPVPHRSSREYPSTHQRTSSRGEADRSDISNARNDSRHSHKRTSHVGKHSAEEKQYQPTVFSPEPMSIPSSGAYTSTFDRTSPGGNDDIKYSPILPRSAAHEGSTSFTRQNSSGHMTSLPVFTTNEGLTPVTRMSTSDYLTSSLIAATSTSLPPQTIPFRVRDQAAAESTDPEFRTHNKTDPTMAMQDFDSLGSGSGQPSQQALENNSDNSERFPQKLQYPQVAQSLQNLHGQAYVTSAQYVAQENNSPSRSSTSVAHSGSNHGYAFYSSDSG